MIQFPAQVSKVQTLVDKSLRLQVDTPEMSAEAMTKIFGMKGAQGWCLLAMEKIKESAVIPEKKPEFKGDKTSSQRLRAVLYVLWEQRGGEGEFDSFYKSKVESVIDRIKLELE